MSASAEGGLFELLRQLFNIAVDLQSSSTPQFAFFPTAAGHGNGLYPGLRGSLHVPRRVSQGKTLFGAQTQAFETNLENVGGRL